MKYKLKSIDAVDGDIIDIPEKSQIIDHRHLLGAEHRITWLEPVKENKK